MLADVDVAYFEPGDTDSTERDADLESRLRERMPELPWEVTNQAQVHTWFEGHFGHAVPPLRSLEEAIASWPEYATCVGVFMTASGDLGVIAPHGLEDHFAQRVRRNPLRVSRETYRRRIEQKQYCLRWPGVTIEPG